MSNLYYSKLWQETERLLDRTLEYDLPLQTTETRIKESADAQATVFTLYLKYIELIRNLDQCYDQIVQPQKRPMIRKLLEMCLGRMLELKNELVDLELTNFNYNDEVYIQLKKTPWDGEIVVPKYYVREREAEISRRKQLMAQIFEKMQAPPSPPLADEVDKSEEEQEGIAIEKEGEDSSKIEEEAVESTQKNVEKDPEEFSEKKIVLHTGGKPTEEEELATLRATLPPPFIDLTPQKRREIRRAKEEARAEERARLAAAEKEEWTAEMKMAVLVIQIAERARQARYKFAVAKIIADQREETRRRQEGQPRPEVKVTVEQKNEAAVKLQRAWITHRNKEKLLKRERELMMMVGMCVPSWKSTKNKERLEEVRMLRHEVQEDNQYDFEEDQRRIYERYVKWDAPWLQESYIEDIRDWFVEWYTKAKVFPEYPSDKDGGLMRVLLKQVQTPEEYMEEQEKLRAEAQSYPYQNGSPCTISKSHFKTQENKLSIILCRKGEKPAEKKKTKEQLKKEKEAEKEKERKDKEAELKRKQQEEKEDLGFKMKESAFLPDLKATGTAYKAIWKKRNDKDNPWQKHYVDMIEREKKQLVDVEVRKVIDELLRLELERLKEALERDVARKKGKKGMKGLLFVDIMPHGTIINSDAYLAILKTLQARLSRVRLHRDARQRTAICKKGGKKKKKGKEKGKGKGKKKKDPTGDKTTDELFEELYRNNIIRSYPEVKLSSFIGDHNYVASDLLGRGIRPIQALGDIRNLVAQYCIIPVGSPQVHQLAPLIKSVCILGPQGCGKSMLANAVCSELGAVLFDLSPENIAGKYEGKAGLQMLVHLINKMSRLLQPSVILVDGAEKTFYKKIPKTEKELDPKRLKSQLPKIVKGITKDDQVLVLGLSNQPWAARPQQMAKCYNKFIVIPTPDYGSTTHVWEKFLMKYHSIDRLFDVSSLAKASLGYSVGTIESVLKQIMTEKRILSQVYRPITPQEILEVLVQLPPVTAEVNEKFLDWYNKRTPMGKKLAKLLQEEEELKAKMGNVKKK
ncbi:dynein regulatory complex protein 11-like [Periplaneta americana]|uniref:dynein regulatory complex protein 11-like n=1 Tax=Periplaneta americana TaxID=6978 RepID=UPI0037E6FCF7